MNNYTPRDRAQIEQLMDISNSGHDERAAHEYQISRLRTFCCLLFGSMVGVLAAALFVAAAMTM